MLWCVCVWGGSFGSDMSLWAMLGAMRVGYVRSDV